MTRALLTSGRFCFTLFLALCIFGCVRDADFQRGTLAANGGIVNFGACASCEEAPERLLILFVQYWNARAEGRYDDAFRLEAPHIRMQFDGIGSYVKFFSQGMPVEKVDVLGVKRVTERLYEVEVKVYSRVDDPMLSVSHYRDRWVVAERGYRHVVRTLFGFIE